MVQKYCISATNRATMTREDITGPMDAVSAWNWKPDAHWKRGFKYFKVAKYPFYLGKKKEVV